MAGLVALAVVPARADQVTFHDLTDQTTASTTGSHIMTPVCGVLSINLGNIGEFSGEGCTATIFGSNLITNSFTASGCTSVGIGCLLFAGEADGTVSDIMLVVPTLSNIQGAPGLMAVVTFLSDAVVGTTEPGFGITCAQLATLGFSCVGETGSVQLHWSPEDRTDTISFESDTEGVVPEPSSLFLLGSGLIAIGGFVKRRLISA